MKVVCVSDRFLRRMLRASTNVWHVIRFVKSNPLKHLSDSDFEFMPDGSMVWFFRSNWYGNTGHEWSPIYMSRSTDMGKTWSKPENFADLGTLPRLCKLECGVVLLCYARPGMYVQASLNDSGTKWSKPLVVMPPSDRSKLANVKIDKPNFHQWVGACNNPELVPIDKNTALLFYSDFYYPDESGVKRKTILCREIKVEITPKSDSDWNGKGYSIQLDLPALSTIVIKPMR